MNFDCGILDGYPRYNHAHAAILVATPGIPVEWVYAALKLWPDRRLPLKRAALEVDPELARRNAESVAQGDGWKMLMAVPRAYKGPVPLYTQLDLQLDPRPATAISTATGFSAQRIRRWRRTNTFDPLTGTRLIHHKSINL